MDLSWLEKGLKFKSIHVTPGDLIFIVVSYLIVRVVLMVMRSGLKRIGRVRNIETGKIFTFDRLISYVVYTVWAIIALKQVGIDVTLFLAGSAALLVGVGLGLQDVFKDFVSGFVILFEGAVRVGDVIEVDGLVARVLRIDIRTSKVITRTGIIMILPNAVLTSNSVTNWSLEDITTRFKVVVGVKYGSDVRLVEKLLKQAATENPRVDTQKGEPIVVFEDFGDSALIFEVRFWSSALWEMDRVMSELRFRIDELFRENKVTIPFPQRDVHMIAPEESALKSKIEKQ